MVYALQLRQLLVLAELIKYVAERVKELYEEKGELGIASMLYIAFALDKIADYNTLATHRQGFGFKTGIAHTLRGEQTLDFRAEYRECNRIDLTLEWTLEPKIAENRRFGKQQVEFFQFHAAFGSNVHVAKLFMRIGIAQRLILLLKNSPRTKSRRWQQFAVQIVKEESGLLQSSLKLQVSGLCLGAEDLFLFQGQKEA